MSRRSFYCYFGDIYSLMEWIFVRETEKALFVVSRVGNMPFKSLMKGVVPFLIPLVITLILLNIFPALTLTLPKLLTGGVMQDSKILFILGSFSGITVKISPPPQSFSGDSLFLDEDRFFRTNESARNRR